MAKPNKDVALQARIEGVLKQLKGTDKEIIYQLSGLLGICYKTANEHFHAWKAKQTLLEAGFNVDCKHDWSGVFGTAGGLMKECRLCFKTEFVKVENGIQHS